MPIPPKRSGPPRRLVGDDESAAIPVNLNTAKPQRRPSSSEGGGLARIPSPTKSPAAAAAAPQPNVWIIAETTINCPHCGSGNFQLRKGDTNALVCDQCTRIEWFVGEPQFGPPPPEKIPKPR